MTAGSHPPCSGLHLLLPAVMLVTTADPASAVKYPITSQAWMKTPSRQPHTVCSSDDAPSRRDDFWPHSCNNRAAGPPRTWSVWGSAGWCPQQYVISKHKAAPAVKLFETACWRYLSPPQCSCSGSGHGLLLTTYPTGSFSALSHWEIPACQWHLDLDEDITKRSKHQSIWRKGRKNATKS